MRIFSQNLTKYQIPIPDDSILRINLAWCNSIDELKTLLEKHKDHNIFVDLPIGRTKPPHNNYIFSDLIPILETYSNIKYFAISNVNSFNDIKEYIESIPKHVSLVPKIESPEGIKNIEEITNSLGENKIIMLDHDDLYSNLIKQKELPSKFKEYIKELIDFCEENNVQLLRTIGVVFSDEEKRTTQYMK